MRTQILYSKAPKDVMGFIFKGETKELVEAFWYVAPELYQGHPHRLGLGPWIKEDGEKESGVFRTLHAIAKRLKGFDDYTWAMYVVRPVWHESCDGIIPCHYRTVLGEEVYAAVLLWDTHEIPYWDMERVWTYHRPSCCRADHIPIVISYGPLHMVLYKEFPTRDEIAKALIESTEAMYGPVKSACPKECLMPT